MDCLERSTELEVYSEASPAMKDWRIRGNNTIRRIVGSSACRVVVFKPLTDSHRVVELLNEFPNSAAVWLYRRFEDRANSSVARFGNNNQELLTAFSKGERFDEWQAMGLTAENLELLRAFDYQAMTPQSAAAVFWYLRNSLYFDQELDKREDVLPFAYEDLVTNPKFVMPAVCRFLDCEFQDAMIANIHAKSVGRAAADIDESVRQLCEPMYERLRVAQEQRWRSLGLAD
jgi:hypothetical protein